MCCWRTVPGDSWASCYKCHKLNRHTHLWMNVFSIVCYTCMNTVNTRCSRRSLTADEWWTDGQTVILTDERHDDVDFCRLDVSEERQNVVNDSHLVETVQQTINTRQHVQTSLDATTQQHCSPSVCLSVCLSHHMTAAYIAPWQMFRACLYSLSCHRQIT